MKQQFVDVVEVHVIVVHDILAVGIADDVAIRVHLSAPRLGLTGQQLLWVRSRVGDDRLNVGYLTVSVGIEMTHGTIR